MTVLSEHIQHCRNRDEQHHQCVEQQLGAARLLLFGLFRVEHARLYCFRPSGCRGRTLSVMTKQHWLVKSEPSAYAWADLLRDGETDWTGVRNYQARAHLAAMRVGDLVFFYESVSTKAVLGIAEVTQTAAPDFTATGADAAKGWISVKLRAVRALPQPVTLAQIKSDPTLADIPLIRQSRLSVMPLDAKVFHKIEKLGCA